MEKYLVHFLNVILGLHVLTVLGLHLMNNFVYKQFEMVKILSLQNDRILV